MIKRLRSLCILILLVTVIPLSKVGSQVVADPKASAKSLDQYARSASALGFSGTVLIANGQEIIHHEGYGWSDRTRRVPNDTRTMFYIASLSKQFTAAAVLWLEAHGKLSATDKISRYFTNVPNDKASITIHQLLTHNSGLARFGWDDATQDWRVMTRDASVEGILNSKLVREPGSRFEYGNQNYILLAALVEEVSGIPFQSFVREHLLRPAGVDSVRFGTDPSVAKATASNVAVGYSDGASVGSYIERPKSWLRVGGGDVMISVGDLFRWHRALLDGKVLPAAQREKLFAMQTTIEPGYGYGYGWWVREAAGGKRVIFHGGDFQGYHSEFRWYPDSNLTVIVATNDEFHGASIAEAFLNQVVGVYRGQDSPLPPVVKLAQDQLRSVEGSYFASSGAWLQVSIDDGVLQVESAEPRAAEILADGDADGARKREEDGERALDLVGRLKHGASHPYASVLAPHLAGAEQDFTDEWNSLGARNGRLRSYQILSTAPQAASDVSVSYVRLNFERGTTIMGYAWKDSKLEYTTPGAKPEPGKVVCAPVSPTEFISVDWRSGRQMKLVFSQSKQGKADALNIVGRAGNMTALSREKPSKRGADYSR